MNEIVNNRVNENLKISSDKKIGLALSGGGAKGAAHIGVLQAFKEAGIDIYAISGTSSGSIVAALYACGFTPYHIVSMFKMYSNQIINFDTKLLIKMFTGAFNSKRGVVSLTSGNNLENAIRMNCKYVGITNINQIKMPLVIPTVDLNTSEIVYFSNTKINGCSEKSCYLSGSIAKIVRASCSYPILFDPVIYNTKMLVDGGLRLNVPVSVLKDIGCDIVIAVCFEKEFERLKGNDIVRVGARCLDIMSKDINKHEIESADFVINQNLNEVGLLDFNKINYAVNEGYISAKKFLHPFHQS